MWRNVQDWRAPDSVRREPRRSHREYGEEHLQRLQAAPLIRTAASVAFDSFRKNGGARCSLQENSSRVRSTGRRTDGSPKDAVPVVTRPNCLSTERKHGIVVERDSYRDARFYVGTSRGNSARVEA